MERSPEGLKGNMFSLLGLLLAMIIILLLAFKLMPAYFSKPVSDKRADEAFKTEGIDTSSQKAVVDSVKRKADDISKQIEKQNMRLEEINK